MSAGLFDDKENLAMVCYFIANDGSESMPVSITLLKLRCNLNLILGINL